MVTLTTDIVRSGRVVRCEEPGTTGLGTQPGVQVCSSVSRVRAAVTLAGEVPVPGDVQSPGHRAPQQVGVGDGQLAPGGDVAGRHQGQAVVCSV